MREPKTHEGSIFHTRKYWDVKTWKADYILIMLGTNDSKEDNWDPSLYENDLGDLADEMSSLDPKPKGIFLLIPPRLEPTEQVVAQMKMQPNVVAYDIPRIVRSIADNKGMGLINLSMIYQDPLDPDRVFAKGEKGFWSGDGCHPNDEAYQIMAKEIADHLTPFLAQNDNKEVVKTDEPSKQPSQVPVSRPSIYPTSPDIITSAIADVAIEQSKEEAASAEIDYDKLKMQHSKSLSQSEKVIAAAQKSLGSLAIPIDLKEKKEDRKGNKKESSSGDEDEPVWMPTEEPGTIPPTSIHTLAPNTGQIAPPTSTTPVEGEEYEDNNKSSETKGSAQANEVTFAFNARSGMFSDMAKPQSSSAAAGEVNLVSPSLRLQTKSVVVKKEDFVAAADSSQEALQANTCRFTYQRRGDVTVPVGCVLIADSNLDYIQEGKLVPAIYACPSADGQPLRIDQEGLIYLGLVKTGAHEVQWKVGENGSMELDVKGHEEEMIEKSLISYIHSGQGVTTTWFTGPEFDGMSRKHSQYTLPDLSKNPTGKVNDNVHSLTVEIDSSANRDAEHGHLPLECKIYQNLKAALIN